MARAKLTDKIMAEVINFGGIPTLRSDVLHWYQERDFSAKQIDYGVFHPKAINEKAWPRENNPNFQD